MPLASSRRHSKDSKINPMNMRIPHNPKYGHIKSSLDTGASMSRYMNKIEEIRRNYRYRKDEIFKRMKLSTFVQLVIKIAEYNRNINELPDDVPSTPTTVAKFPSDDREEANASPSVSLALSEGDFGDDPMITTRSTLESVSRGIGEMDLNTPNPTTYHSELTQNPECPYLLLDVRDSDSFFDCHIITAVSFPIAMLSRSINSEIPELIQYKNRPGKVILVYDEDERIAVRAATTLVEHGYDNLFVLSGGLKLAARYYTDGFITGTLPISCTNHKESHIIPASQTEFTQHDIDKLNLLLDNALQDRTVGDTLDNENRISRLSKASTASSRMSKVSVNSTIRSGASDFLPDRPPFRP